VLSGRPLQTAQRLVLTRRLILAPRVLVEDDAVLAVDKPPGVACLPGGGGADGEDLRARLGSELRAPETIEREASGVVVLAKTKAAAAALAKEVEAGRVERTFHATVEGRLEKDRLTLRERAGRGRRGTDAVTDVRVVERGEEATLVELRVREGRPAQLRGQLARAGHPVVGDREHGGRPSGRLCLASLSVALAHPLTGERLAVEAPLPVVMRAVLGGPHAALDRDAIDRALRDAAELRRPLLLACESPETTTAFRLVAGAADGISGLAVDVYGEHLVAHFFEGELATDERVVLDALEALGFRGIYVKRRPKQANELVDTRREEIAPRNAVRGEDAPDPLVVREDGVPFLARLGDGLSTGIFLDQRDNRRRVREWARGARVLNLFAYEGAFTVAAAIGGARETLSIDVSGPALERLRENLASAGVAGTAHAVEKADVFEALERLHAEGRRFDIVIADPPTYSTTKQTRWSSGRGWERLGLACLAVLERGGRLVACSNEAGPGGRAFVARIRRAVADARVKAEVREVPPPLDFPRGGRAGTSLRTVVVERAPIS
jgi:23S rRNA (cytosine1962-C5)-methyltransferase